MMQQNILTTLTLNILFDTRHENKNSSFLQKYHIKFSEERFEQIIKKIEELSPDIVTFNQVTVRFLHFLEKSKIISENYVRSSSDYNPKTKYDVQGNLIMVKKIVQKVQFQKLELKSHNQPVHIAYLTFNHRRIAAASVHLLAFKGNTKQRQEQLREITNYFNEKQQQKKLNLVLLQGDMNFHSQTENIVLDKLGIQDMWTQKYDLVDNPGYTFDSEKNLMINQLYWGFEQRRMRLDRIFTLKFEDKDIMKLEDIEIILNEPIYQSNEQKEQRKFMNMFQSTVSLVGDIFGKNSIRNKQSYLFLSDHFGLHAKISIK